MNISSGAVIGQSLHQEPAYAESKGDIRIATRLDGPCKNLFGVMFDPAGSWVVLFDLPVPASHNTPILPDHEARGARCSLVNCEDVHDS